MRIPEPESIIEPALRATRPGRLAAAACALVLLAVLCGVKLVRYRAQAESKPRIEARATKPTPVEQSAALALPGTPPYGTRLATAADRSLPSRRVAKETSHAPRGERGWVIRRR